MSELLNEHIDDKGVATITLTTPGRHNALDDEVIAELDSIFQSYHSRQDIHIVILRGEGKSFCAGADINWMKRAGDLDGDDNFEDAKMLADMLYKLYSLPQLTVACVQGRAVGGGLGMAAACDYVIAAKDAVFSFPEVKLGLIPATISPFVIEALGARNCKRYFQTAESFDAFTAQYMGLVQTIVEREQDIDYALVDLHAKLERNGPHAMREAKKLCLNIADEKITDDISSETASRLAIIRSGDEAKEGLAAFLEKRDAKFR